ncbi:MAG: hypothetical protein UX33_C0043G0005 [Candidatus Azambacteria bacterium GW2011_GWC1_46_13]|uniref:Uncharacterized protein n=1 Tax=Candidatus Azambacteria bacterium GW2011_GWC1_46_13 TaxID=1618619 RepID=A0A0G1NJX3_9BACT|nr:MAG: hypothetical protein UX33_C0043G0005 [Candidatus Azambacteria bacterium GW2011_GWC1_46_13]
MSWGVRVNFGILAKKKERFRVTLSTFGLLRAEEGAEKIVD